MSSARNPLLVLTPIEPRTTGNGLAMRAASFVKAAQADFDVRVAVVPIAGSVPGTAGSLDLPTSYIPLHTPSLRGHLVSLLADPSWRGLLSATEPMPVPARLASPAIAPLVVEISKAEAKTPVHAVRSYLGPLALAVAHQLDSPWRTLDLDDDDEALAVDATTAGQYRKLVGTLAPLFSAVSAASDEDATALSQRHDLAVQRISNAAPEVPVLPRTWSSHNTVLFVGNLTYRPNIEAAESLAREVMPLLRSELKSPVRLVIAGPFERQAKIAELDSLPMVEVRGYVDDLGPLYAQADIVVAPIPVAGGTRIKLLEAFAQRVPVVTTPAGARGLAVEHRTHLLIGSSPRELADAATSVLTSKDLARRLIERAAEFVRQNHAQEVVASQVRLMFQVASSAGVARR